MSWVYVGAGAVTVLSTGVNYLSSKKSADAAKKGSTNEIEFLRESRDIARADQEPYRQAGVTALDALMTMTGLVPRSSEAAPEVVDAEGRRSMVPYSAGVIPEKYLSGLALAPLGAFGGRALGGDVLEGEYYNVNELEPESVYQGGSYTRTSNPTTIAPYADGYVKRGRALNIQGRGFGGFLKKIAKPIATITGASFGGLGGALIANKVADKRLEAISGSKSSGQQNIEEEEEEDTGFQGFKGTYDWKTDPGYEFRFREGQRALERGAAAAGGLLSGGFARRAMRYGQDYASQEYSNVYNRIANIAGLGQVGSQISSNAALSTGAGMGTAAAQAGYAAAAGKTGKYNAIATGINQLSQLPWDKLFKK